MRRRALQRLRISELKNKIKNLGPVNINAVEDYKEVSERYEFMQKQHEDIVTAEAHLTGLMEELEDAMRRQFNAKFKDIKRVFQEVFVELFGGGEARLELTDDDVLVKMGGPMMGFPQSTLDVPMMKGSNGIIAIDTDETKEQPCIKCGRCVDVCPMELSPLYFVKYAKEENWQGMKDMNVMDCVECRCCQYICSSKIPIIDSIKAGKNAIRGMK